MKKLLHHPFFIRLLHWEYWNSKLIYLPLYPYWFWLSIRSGSFFFPTAANPRIKNGGLIMEGKKDIYDQLPEWLYPKTCYFEPDSSIDNLLSTLAASDICYPLIVKPDKGERGLAVKKIYTEQELIRYATNIPFAFLAQAFVPYEKEVGIFYYRMPGEAHGQISGIVNKTPVTVTGDGISTIEQLVKGNKRYLLQWKQIKNLNISLHKIPETGEKITLIPYGNHCRGSEFTDHSRHITAKLSESIDRICKQLPEFYYGRLDIRFSSWEELEEGKALMIIEVNGSGSEPTHIYDPEHSIFYAWGQIIKHWDILYRISKENNRRGTPYLSLLEGRREINAFKQIDMILSAHNW